MRKSIEWLITGQDKIWIEENYRDGGYVYDTTVRGILKQDHDLKVSYLCRGNSRNPGKRVIEFIEYLGRNHALELESDIVVRDPFSTAYAPFNRKNKHVVLMHHINVSSTSNRMFNKMFVRLFFKRILKADCVVTVSEYWRDIMAKKGCKNIKVIYNAFDTEEFNFSENELSEFIDKMGFPKGKTIIYLGNAEPEKGYLQAYEALKNIDAVLVVTGKSKLDVPIIQKYLSYSDYLKLLSVSTLAITMSQFNEGWCRTAHEAMLCGTPVLGSGRGGMKELLKKGGQRICCDFIELTQTVKELLEDEHQRRTIGNNGKVFSSKYNMKYFENEWLDLISKI
jgi:glycosyltransferase involved in cell wall biosynthesis